MTGEPLLNDEIRRVTQLLDEQAAAYLEHTPRSAVEEWVRDREPGRLYTATIKSATAGAVTRAWESLEQFRVTAADRYDPGLQADPLVRDVLAATVRRANRISATVDYNDAQLLDLLRLVVDAVSVRFCETVIPLSRPTNPVTGFACVTFPRVTGTPYWGRGGDAPLVLEIGRDYLTDHDRTLQKPWTWRCYPDPHADPTGTYADVIAPPAGPDAAREVGRIVADVLAGRLPLTRP